MGIFCVSRRFGWCGEITDKVGAVMRMFGVSRSRLDEVSVEHRCELEINCGDVVYITGPSGCGKSVLLRELEKEIAIEDRINLGDIELVSDKAVIDCVDGDFVSALKVLSTAGLNDCFCVLNRPAYLSDGQKYRFRLAMALASKKKYVFSDEFCMNLDRITAAVIAYNVQRYAKSEGVTFILAGSSDDVLVDLAADVLVVKELGGDAEVVYKKN